MRLPMIMVEKETMASSSSLPADSVPFVSTPPPPSPSINDKSSTANNTGIASAAPTNSHRKNGVFGSAPVMMRAWRGRYRRGSSSSSHMDECMSFSSLDSDADELYKRHSSSETGSVSSGHETVASGESEPLDGVEECLICLQAQLAECRARRDDINKYDTSYKDAKSLVRQMAQDLVMKIREHEARLLEEIDARRDTIYKRLGCSRQNLDAQITALEAMCSQGYDLIEDCAQKQQPPEIADNYQEVLATLKHGLDSPDLRLKNSDVKVLPIHLNPIRCNTAFASLDTQPNEIPGTRRKSVITMNGSPRKPGRSRARSLQPSSSVGYSMDLLGVQSTDSTIRRYSLQPHVGSISPGLHSSLRKRQACLCESSEEAGTHLVWEIVSEGPTLGQINCPNDLMFLPNGDLVVSDRDNHRLQLFDKKGRVLSTIGDGKITPRRINMTNEGNIVLTDSKDSTVKVFDQTGKPVSTWGRKRFKQLFRAPCGVACTSRGQYVVSDTERHTVTIHNNDGKVLRHLGGEGGGVMEFHSPSYIACVPNKIKNSTRNKNIIVSDNWNHCVQIFDEQGNFVCELEGKTDLCYPNGVACDESGNIYVAEWGSHSVSQYTPEGKFQKQILSRNEHNIYHPAGLAIHGNLLAVSEYSDTHSAVRMYSFES